MSTTVTPPGAGGSGTTDPRTDLPPAAVEPEVLEAEQAKWTPAKIALWVAIALVGGGMGLSIVPRAATNLRLPGVIYRELACRRPSMIELTCLYRKGDVSPVLQGFLQILREFRD